MAKQKIIITGGGSAGHILPLISVANELKNAEVHYLGSGFEAEREEARENNLKYHVIFSGKFRRNLSIENLFLNVADIFKFIIGFFQAIKLIGQIQPTVIFSKGGFVALPVCYASRFLHVPVVIHESDIEMGLANKLCANFADSICLGFPEEEYNIPKKNTFYTGVPLRKEFDDKVGQESANKILVIGGSLGAVSLNNLIFSNIEAITKNYSITHLTGNFDYKRMSDLYAKLPEDVKAKYTILPFEKNIKDLMVASSLIIARAGATTIFECASLGKALILVPIPTAIAPHQLKNAKYLEANKMALLVGQDKDPSSLVETIKKATLQKAELKSEIKKLSFIDSGKVIAEKIQEYIQREELRRVKKIHFIGYRGVSMNQLFEICKSLGMQVTGSDIKESGHSPNYITKDIDLVVYSSAITKSSPAYEELETARRAGIKCIKRSEFVGLLMNTKKSICISGMHGKTTVTSAISYLLEKVYPETSYLIGAPSSEFKKFFKYSDIGPIVVEACEYDRSFLDMPCNIAVISNIEKEHLDYYKGGIEEIKSAFKEFLLGVKTGGKIFINAEDDNTQKIIHEIQPQLAEKKIKTVSVGFNSGNYKVSYSMGKDSIQIHNGGRITNLKTSLLGKYNAFNIALAFAVMKESFDINGDELVENIKNFKGPARRFQNLYTSKIIQGYDDYAHHPTELESLFSMIDENFVDYNKVVIYEQHQQKRFDEFYSDYLSTFAKNKIDSIILLPVFRIAGREGEGRHTSVELAESLRKEGKQVFFANNYDEASKIANGLIKKQTIIVTVGATDVYKVHEKINH